MFKKMFLIPALFLLSINVAPKYADASSPGEVTTADSTVTINKKVTYPNMQANNSLFQTNISIVSPGYSNGRGDAVYPTTYTITKKVNDYYRLVNVIPYIENPTFSITHYGTTKIGNGSYVWDETLNSWVLPNPLETTMGDVDTSTGIRFYLVGDNVDVLPLSYLKNDPSLTGGRPVVIIDDVASIPVNEPQRITFDIYQERALDHASRGFWYALSYYPSALVEYEFDGTLKGTNPYDQHEVTEGDSVSFHSEINIASPTTISADMVWQVSVDGGNTYTDIEETSTNSGGQNNIDKTLEFIPTIDDHNNLYRVKIIPNEIENPTPIYTESAVLKFDQQYLVGGDVAIQYQDTEGKTLSPTIVKSGNVGDAYESEQIAVEGYTFSEVIGNPTGMFTKEDQVVTYIYQKNPIPGKDVAIQYQDTEGQTLSATLVKSGNIGESYESEQLALEGYTFKEVIGNPTGTFTDQVQTVTYIYQKNVSSGKDVTIEYQDMKGATLAPTIVKSGNVGEPYDSEEKAISGYTFKEIKGQPTGTYTNEAQNVTYIYEKNVSTGKEVNIQYQDTKGSKIAPNIVKAGNIGEQYVSEQLAILGYTFKEIKGQPTGTFSAEVQTVTYVYTKNKKITTGTSSKKEPSKPTGKKAGSKSNPKSVGLPKTGEANSFKLIIAGVIILLVGGGYIVVIKRKKEK